MAEYSRVAKGHFVSSGSAQVINLPFQPDSVQVWNYSAYNSAATSQNVLDAYWDVSMGQGLALIKGYNSSPALIGDVVPSNGISSFAAGQLLQFGPQKQIVGATAANPPVFNVTAHGYSVGQTVVFQGLEQSDTTGMQQMAGAQYTIIAVSDANHFSVNWDASDTSSGYYTALSGSPSGAYVKQVLYPMLYEPAVSYIYAIATTSGLTQVTTTNYHNLKVGQEVAFSIPSAFGMVQLNSLPNNSIPGSPQYYYVTSVIDNWNFTINQSISGFTPFTTALEFSTFPGQTFAQVVPVGDVNSGGESINSSSSLLYPPPFFPTPNNGINSINGPAIKGAFVNNTSQGFVIGAGAGRVLTTASLVGASTNVLYWRAYLSDLAVN